MTEILSQSAFISSEGTIQDDRSIWRIPTEIWRQIFAEAASRLTESPDQETFVNLFLPLTFTPTLISSVCRRWREIGLGFSDLWNEIVIPSGNLNSADFDIIQTNYSRAGAGPKSLIFNARNAGKIVHILVSLKKMLEREEVLDRVVLIIWKPASYWASNVLNQLPPTKEFWILAHPDSVGFPDTTFPIIYLTILTRLVVDGVSLVGTLPTQLEELTLRAGATGLSNALCLYMSESIHSLKVVSARGHGAADWLNCTLIKLHTLKMSIQYLAYRFLPIHSVPNLTTIEITEPSLISDAGWAYAKSRINISNIKKVLCYSMSEHTTALIRRVEDFTGLEHLELRGDSVDPILKYLANQFEEGEPTFPILLKLTISSYRGSARSVLAFYRERQLLSRVYGSVEGKMPELQLENCTRVSSETSRALKRLLGDHPPMDEE